jgi:[acyl-carrier-protein] S-malonyltransferase
MSGRIAFVFPGQGSQAVGMGADLAAQSAAARDVFAAADDALGFALSDLCFHGPDDQLRQTINTQPAITTVSLAALAALRAELGQPLAPPPTPPAVLREPCSLSADGARVGGGADIPIRQDRGVGESSADLLGPPWPDFVAGHSVGEYTALIASGAVGLADGLRLVRERGRLMHQEGTACASGMAAVLGLDADRLNAICAQAEADVAHDPHLPEHPGAGKVVVANDNAPGQIVLSGETTALARAMQLAQEAGAKRVIPLAVSGAFHSPVMASAAPALAQAIAAAGIRDAQVPLIANITAQPLTQAADLRAELAAQIAAPVQWVRSVQWLATEGGVTTFVEIGAGQVLSGLIKRIAKGATILNAGAPAEIAATAQALRDLGFGGPI